MILVHKSTVQYFGYSVRHIRDSRANRCHTLYVALEGMEDALHRKYKMSWRRFKKAVLKEFLIRL